MCLCNHSLMGGLVSDELVGKAIEAIGRTSLDPSAWQHALESVAPLLGGFATTLEVANTQTGQVRMECPFPLDAKTRELYEQCIFQINPRVTTALANPVGTVVSDHALNDNGHSAEFFDWLSNTPSRFFQGSKILHNKHEIGFFSTQYEQVLSEQEAREHGRLCELLMPHMINALEISRHLSGTALVTSPICDPELDGAKPFLLLDRAGYVIACSPGFEEMARNSGVVDIVKRRLVAKHFRHRGSMDRFMRDAVKANLIDTRPSGLRLSTEPYKRGFAFRATRLPVGDDIFSVFRPAAMIIMIDLDRPTFAQRDELVALFELTEREAEVAVQIAAGRSPEQAGGILNITTNTIRQHIKSVYRKTGTVRQSELVQLIALLN